MPEAGFLKKIPSEFLTITPSPLERGGQIASGSLSQPLRKYRGEVYYEGWFEFNFCIVV